MNAVAIVCSGQGAQSSTMFSNLADAPAAEPVFQSARRVLGGTDPRDLARQSRDGAIFTNKIGQILCCTQAMAAWAVIGDAMPRPLMVAGYSVGELAAWGVAGVLDADAILDLAVARAAAMDAATSVPSGLVAIRGLTRPTLEKLCQASGCFIAIVNATDQMLVGGTEAALKTIILEASAAGAQRTALLPVAVASHTPLLAAASESFSTTLAKTAMRPLPSGIRLLSGIDGSAVYDVHAGAAKLARQIRQTVDWASCMDACHAAGVTKVVELGPGAALAHLARDCIADVQARSLADFHTLAGFTRWAC